jgi:hypothetical protein
MPISDLAVPYSPPISNSFFPGLCVLFLTIGFVLSALYFVYQMRTEKSLVTELSVALISSVALAFGTLFLMLSFGLYP